MMERIVPREKWLYNDRGMMKWMGWLLSDHSTFMEKKRHEEQNSNEIKPQMKQTDISELLQKAWLSTMIVTIQLNILNLKEQESEYTGVIMGFDEERIYLQSPSEKMVAIKTIEIRNVSVPETQKWWLNEDTL